MPSFQTHSFTPINTMSEHGGDLSKSPIAIHHNRSDAISDDEG